MTDVREATHVRSIDNPKIERIKVKWGIDQEGRLAPPSAGGFGVITESGRDIDMWHAAEYYVIRDKIQ